MRPVHVLLLCTLTLVLGFGLGRFTASSQVVTAMSHEASPARAAATSFPEVVRPSDITTRPIASDLDGVLQGFDATSRQGRLAALGERWGRLDPRGGWALLARIPGLADRQAFAEALIRAWALDDVSAALAACQTLPAGELRVTTTAQAAAVWAKREPRQAATHCAAQFTGSVRRAALAAVVQQWAQQSAADAATWCLTQNESLSSAALPEVMRHWANVDPQAAAQWAHALPNESTRTTALESLVQEWADQYPAEAAAWAGREAGAAPTLAPFIAQSWAASDPAAAAQWAQSTHSGEAISTAVATWAAADAKAALQWVAGHPAESRGELQQIVLGAWALEDPPAALAEASRLADPALRDQLTKTLLLDWQIRAPQEAAQWQGRK
jgi:hypothetical protein